jgi:hypothetical protein
MPDGISFVIRVVSHKPDLSRKVLSSKAGPHTHCTANSEKQFVKNKKILSDS